MKITPKSNQAAQAAYDRDMQVIEAKRIILQNQGASVTIGGLDFVECTSHPGTYQEKDSKTGAEIDVLTHAQGATFRSVGQVFELSQQRIKALVSDILNPHKPQETTVVTDPTHPGIS